MRRRLPNPVHILILTKNLPAVLAIAACIGWPLAARAGQFARDEPLVVLPIGRITPGAGTLAAATPLGRGAPSGGARVPTGSDTIVLMTQEPGEQPRAVEGIVCDNLRGMPPAQRNHLVVQLPDKWLGARIVSYSAANGALSAPVGKPPPPQGGASAGTLALEAGQLLYYPPDEFNPDPEPIRRDDLIKDAQRTVDLAISVAMPGSDRVETLRTSVLLRRPPVVLVHGVNSSAATWTDPRDVGTPLARELTEFGFDLKLLEHGNPPPGSKNPEAQDQLTFHGNGPVEYAAELLDRQVQGCLEATRRGSPSFAIRRVDIVAHSYGGVIARWFLRMASASLPKEDTRTWYVHAVNNSKHKDLYRLDDAWFSAPQYKSALPGPCVRKLITLGSPWRGTPIANYINQMRSAHDPLRLISAPILFNPRFTLGTVVDKLLMREDLPVKVITKAPSFEVNAVESPWLRFLNGTAGASAPRPFLDGVAYASLAGDNTDFLSRSALESAGLRGFKDLGIDLFALLTTGQSPSRFPYLALERRAGSAATYSDGLIPLWSALLPGGKVVSANHSALLINDEAHEAVLCWLNSATLPTGQVMNSRWGEPVQSRILEDTAGSRRQWNFVRGTMAPYPQSDIYGLVGGIGRIRPGVYENIRDVAVSPAPGGATFSWSTPLDMECWVAVYELRLINFSRWEFVEVQLAGSGKAGKAHRVQVSGLDPAASYYFKIISDYTDALDGVLELQSDFKKVRFSR